MNIALVGNFTSDDEGMAKTAHQYADHLDDEHAVTRVDLVGSSIPNNLRQLRMTDPDVIHYVPGPSRGSFLFTKLASWLVSDAIVVHSAMHPKSEVGPPIVYRHVDLLLHQSDRLADQFNRVGIRTVPLASGIDTDRFSPVPDDERLTLRERYDVPAKDDIILHVGHINAGRGVDTLAKLLNDGMTVLLVGSERNSDRELVESLRNRGCRVITEYQPRIEELYQLADVYAFPVPPKNEMSSINVPLSVLEALATGLPVASTRYGALDHFFADSSAVQFADAPKDLNTVIREVLTANQSQTKIRDVIAEYSWERIGTQLSDAYLSTLERKHGTV